MSPDLSRYVTDQLALETSVLKERRKAREERAAKPWPKAGKVMPGTGERHCMHTFINITAELAERGTRPHTSGSLGGLWHRICYLCLCLRCCNLAKMLIHCLGQCSCDAARWIFVWPIPCKL